VITAKPRGGCIVSDVLTWRRPRSTIVAMRASVVMWVVLLASACGKTSEPAEQRAAPAETPAPPPAPAPTTPATTPDALSADEKTYFTAVLGYLYSATTEDASAANALSQLSTDERVMTEVSRVVSDVAGHNEESFQRYLEAKATAAQRAIDAEVRKVRKARERAYRLILEALAVEELDADHVAAAVDAFKRASNLTVKCSDDAGVAMERAAAKRRSATGQDAGATAKPR
jgi:hypothetical protein